MGRTSLPLVSVGIPLYNEERFLEQTLGSITAIDYPNLEIVILDNGSTDLTESICKSFVRKDARIRYHREEKNRGAMFSWNKVFELTHGTYFFWSGGHDLWDPQFLRRCVPVLEDTQDVVLAFPRTTYIDAQGIEGKTLLMSELDTRGLSPVRRYTHLLSRLNQCSIMHGLWCRSALEGSVFFSLAWGPDNLLLAQMSLRGAFASVPEATWYRREIRTKETREQRKARIIDSLIPLSNTPQKRPRASSVEKALRAAHYRMIREEMKPGFQRIYLLFLTWYVFAYRHGLYPFQKYISPLLRLLRSGRGRAAGT